MKAINETSKNYKAVKYGRSDNLVAGEDGFKEFYESYQDELDEIGKRPDILVYKTPDYDNSWGEDISKLDRQQLNQIVPKAVAGLEIRSSSFLSDKYDEEMRKRRNIAIQKAIQAKETLLIEYADIFNHPKRNQWIKILNSVKEENLDIISFKVPGWRSSQRLQEANNLLKNIKSAAKELQKRDFLSITPKAEDIKVVYKWIQNYNVPHYYCQVFFDKVYGISFQDILSMITNPDREGIDFFIEQDTKNQNKTTIKINSKIGIELASKVTIPQHSSQMRELDRGRLLFYVTFKGGRAYLNVSKFLQLLNIQETDF